ncbi:hypothetical protein RB7815 [Rhodopirellula baltica SH 1]|uniref:Uncharacterized protein n=1 Tax=Rhodopirellula baltica (strain DSM 10527 / NCIMB 13988 / SH1) TaxID=243090 RepID=Q7UN33_RHOBA|nr:hypothetical protein RB7815 [Rhodopirellula baltica SH 1]
MGCFTRRDSGGMFGTRWKENHQNQSRAIVRQAERFPCEILLPSRRKLGNISPSDEKRSFRSHTTDQTLPPHLGHWKCRQTPQNATRMHFTCNSALTGMAQPPYFAACKNLGPSCVPRHITVQLHCFHANDQSTRP